MVPRGSSRFKRESTANGLITPDESMTSSGTAYPKYEEIDSVSFSNRLQDKLQRSSPFPSYHGLPSESESFEREASERYRRSEAVSVRSSYPPPPFQPRVHNIRNNRKNSPSSPSTMSSSPVEKGGLATVGRATKRLVLTLQELRGIGLKSIDHELPELVLCGDQSAGKSSLMSGIAEINLPTGDSMCTKCPTNIKTLKADSWSCKISLQNQYKPTSRSNMTNEVSEFPGWQERKDKIETHHFTTIYQQSELEQVLKWAQIALLNPSQDYTSFIPGSDGFDEEERIRQDPDHKEKVRFSPNVILVEISGPGLEPLSFFDLPGLFQTAEDAESQYLVPLFEALTEKYVKHPNALIICAVAMRIDPGLSRTKAVIANCNAEDRCIGVLTMPDILGSSDYDNILKEKTFILPHGYFVTKRPGKNSRIPRGDNYHSLARKEEDEFFNSDENWREGGPWARFRHRCGIATLQEYLSKAFAKLILASLPDLERKIQGHARSVDEQLSRLPEIPQNRAAGFVKDGLKEFEFGVRQILDGGAASSFYSEWNRLCYQFQKATEQMVPRCKVGHPSDQTHMNDDNSDDEGSVILVSHRTTKRPLQQPDIRPDGGKKPRHNKRTPSPGPVKWETNAYAGTPAREVPKAVKGKNAHTKPGLYRKLDSEEFGPFYKEYLDSGCNAMSIEDIQSSIKDNGCHGKPGTFNHNVKVDFALLSIIPWNEPLDDFVLHTFSLLSKHIHAILSKSLVNFKDTPLYRNSKPIIDEFLATHETKQAKKSTEFYNMEKSTLFTINDHAFNINKAEALAHLRAQRRKVRVDLYLTKMYRVNAKQSLKEFKMEQRDKVTDEKLDQKLGPDSTFDTELEVAAYIRGYYHTARLRFIDSVCAEMNFKLFHEIRKGAGKLLRKGLGLEDERADEARYHDLLTGDAKVAEHRATLRATKEQLTKFAETLSRLRRGIDDDESELSAMNNASLIELVEDENHTLRGSDATLEESKEYEYGTAGTDGPTVDLGPEILELEPELEGI